MPGPRTLVLDAARRLVRAARAAALTRAAVRVDGSRLPPRQVRWCGPEFKDDAYFLRSAEREARRLADEFGCGPASRVLDVGCGWGRLPIGLLRVIGEVDYTGADVHAGAITWCRRHVQRHHPSYRFLRLDVQNDRYNPGGQGIGDGFRLPFPDARFDVVYLYSVFSHMTEEHVRAYLREFARVLAPGGGVFLTAFAERGVPAVSVNPPDSPLETCGPLHVVRYDQDHLLGMIAEAGFQVAEFSHGTETDGQSAVSLRRKAQPAAG